MENELILAEFDRRFGKFELGGMREAIRKALQYVEDIETMRLQFRELSLNVAESEKYPPLPIYNGRNSK